MKLSFQFANYENILENYIGNTAVWWMTEENSKFISKICLTFIQSDFKKNLFYAIRLNVNICSANYYFLHLLFWSIWKIVSTEFHSTTNEFPKGFPPVSFWCGIFHFSCLHNSWIPYSLLAAMRCIQMFISAMHKSGFKCIFMLKYFLFVFKTLTRTFQDGLQIGENKCKILEIFFFPEFQVFWIGLYFFIEKSSMSLFFHVCLFGTAWNCTNISTQSSFCWVYYRVTVPHRFVHYLLLCFGFWSISEWMGSFTKTKLGLFWTYYICPFIFQRCVDC